MKLLTSTKRTPHGHVLVTMLVATAIVGIALASYLKLTQTQNVFTARSQIWNNCIPLIEAGVEEALAQLNMFGGSNLVANGWTTTSGGFYKERAIGDGYYRSTVNYSNILTPTILVTGFLPAPSALASLQPPSYMFASLAQPGVKYISRTIRVTLRKEPAFNKGMVCKDKIDLGGNHCLFDSYNSSVGAYNAATAGDKGDLATNSDLSGAVGIGNADIKGHLSTGPKATAKIGPNGRVGSVAWHADPANNGKIQPGWWRRDMNQAIPDVAAPWSGGAKTPLPQDIYKYVLEGGDYQLNSLNLGGSEIMFIKDHSVLYVTGNINISGNIKIQPGATLKVFVGGSKITLSGTYDKQDIPAEFMVFGLPSVKDIDVSGVAAVIYSPSARLNLNGGAQFYGATVTKDARMNGHTGFHYDEALAKVDQYKQYVITSWNEI